MPERVTRRAFLITIGGTGAALIVGCRPGGEPDEAVPTLAPPGQGAGGAPVEPGEAVPVPTAPAQGAESTPVETAEAPVELGTDPRYAGPTLGEIVLTPVDEFFVQSYSAIPEVDAAAWTLVIDGLVASPRTLTLDDLKALPPVEMMRTLECIGNPVGGSLIGNSTWTGVRLADILAGVGIQEEAIRAKFTSSDGYTTSVDLEWILQENTLLVYEMDGQPLTAAHGYPLRILMPGLYGQKMPKWLERIEFIDNAYQGYWERGGWSDIAAVKTNSQIVSPPGLAQLTGGVVIEGIAYAGDNRAITRVEISVGEGEWLEAALVEPPSPAVWTQWYITWQPPGEGVYNVRVRATDDTGFTQKERGGGVLGEAALDGTDAIHGVSYAVKAPAAD